MDQILHPFKAVTNKFVFPNINTQYPNSTYKYLIDGFPHVFIQHKSSNIFMIYFHGNGTDLGSICFKLKKWSETLKVNIISPEYPGYGDRESDGRPTPDLINQEAEFLYQWLRKNFIPAKNIIIFGRSIGTGPALHLASRVDLAGLILMSPFTSIGAVVSELGNQSYFAMTLGFLAGDVFDNVKNVKNVTCPLLILHGNEDALIPCSMGQELFMESGTEEGKKVFALFQGDHNRWSDGEVIDLRASQWLQDYVVGNSAPQLCIELRKFIPFVQEASIDLFPCIDEAMVRTEFQSNTASCQVCEEIFGYLPGNIHHCRDCGQCICTQCAEKNAVFDLDEFMSEGDTPTVVVWICKECASYSPNIKYVQSKENYLFLEAEEDDSLDSEELLSAWNLKIQSNTMLKDTPVLQRLKMIKNCILESFNPMASPKTFTNFVEEEFDTSPSFEQLELLNQTVSVLDSLSLQERIHLIAAMTIRFNESLPEPSIDTLPEILHNQHTLYKTITSSLSHNQ